MIDRLLTADELGIRLEVVNGLPIWEAQPLYKHQKKVERIAQSIYQGASGCQCVHAPVEIELKCGCVVSI